MTLNEFRLLASEVQKHLEEGGKEFSSYQQQLGMACPPGCGACCFNPGIQIAPIEALPYVMSMVELGKGEELYHSLLNNKEDRCFLFEPGDIASGKGRCAGYFYRFTICRSFGVAAVKSKQGENRLSICKVLRERYPSPEESQVNQAPIIGTYAAKIYGLMPRLAKSMPVNKAILFMLEEVLNANFYEALSGPITPPNSPLNEKPA